MTPELRHDLPQAAILVTGPEAGRGALGMDPFAEEVDSDPFGAGLAALGQEPLTAAAASDTPPFPSAPPSPAVENRARSARARPLYRPHRSVTPALAEIELPDPEGWTDRVLGPDERLRLAALSHLAQGGGAFDRFGFSPTVLKRTFPYFYALYRAYFRVESRGSENLPTEGPAILASNHGGLLPFDAAMTVLDVVLHTDPPRLPRAIVDRWAGRLPWINVFFARVGQVIGTRENFADLLRDHQLVLVFPEGMDGIRKPISQRYRLQKFRVGFVEQALRERAPIVPVAVIGSDDQSPILFDWKSLARRLGLPMAPITPTFPWFGPLGLLPYPVKYKIVYGEPMQLQRRFGPEAARDARLVHYLSQQVRRAVQQLVDRNR